MGQVVLGKCKSYMHREPQLNFEQDKLKEAKNVEIQKVKQLLEEFTFYQIEKTTIHSFKFDGVFRKLDINTNKVLKQSGFLQPIDENKIKIINEESSIQFRCSIYLGGQFEQQQFNIVSNEKVDILTNEYVVFKRWDLGEKMIDFQICSEITGIKLYGLINGDQQIYEEVINKNEWNIEDHLLIDDNSYLNLYYNEEDDQIYDNYYLSALILYNGKIIYKKYNQLYEIESDGEEVKQNILQILENNITTPQKYFEIMKNNQLQHFGCKSNIIQNVNIRNSLIQREQYIKLKKFIQNSKQEKYNRNIEIIIQKTTIYQNNDKQIYYNNPIFLIQSSQKSIKTTTKLAQQIEQQVLNWNSKLLKNKLTEYIKKLNLNVISALEKDIIISISKEVCDIKVNHWEDGQLIPYYKNTSYIYEIKQWIIQTQQILFEKTNDPVEQKINQMIKTFFSKLPKVQQIINLPYSKIQFVQRIQPPYDDPEINKIFELSQKQDKILIIWLYDYENEENIERLKQLIQIRKNKKNLQLIILGYLKYNTWTKEFQDFLNKHELLQPIIEQLIETWFPIDEMIGEYYFSTILNTIYGLMLDYKDMMIVDSNGIVRFVEQSKTIIDQFDDFIEKLNVKIKEQKPPYNYWRQYQSFKKCIRENPILKDLSQTIQKGCEEKSAIIIEQKKSKIWTFEQGQVQETKIHEQPTRIIKNIQDFNGINEMARIIAKYIDNNDIKAL